MRMKENEKLKKNGKDKEREWERKREIKRKNGELEKEREEELKRDWEGERERGSRREWVAWYVIRSDNMGSETTSIMGKTTRERTGWGVNAYKWRTCRSQNLWHPLWGLCGVIRCYDIISKHGSPSPTNICKCFDRSFTSLCHHTHYIFHSIISCKLFGQDS